MANNEHRGSTPMAVTPGYWSGNSWVQATAATPFPVEIVAPAIVVNQQVEGQQARDAAISGNNPVLNGARGSTATPAAVDADGDVVDLWANRNGALRVDPVGTTAQPVTDNGGSLTVDGAITSTPNVFVPTTRTASQVTATTTTGAVVAADANRRLLVITNTGSVTVYLDPSGTATTSDYPLPAGASITMTSLDGDGMAQAQWSCITASSTAVLGILTAVA